jgi:hypothetical protein
MSTTAGTTSNARHTKHINGGNEHSGNTKTLPPCIKASLGD